MTDPGGAARRPPRAGDRSTFGTWGDLNVLGLWTLYLKEVRRFLKVTMQTLVAPMATTLMFLAVFALALGGTERTVAGVPFLQFLAPGLLVMAVVQNAFANTSSSVMIAKMQGNIIDYLMPPLGPGELTFGLVMGGVTRGMMVAATVSFALLPFVRLVPAHPVALLASLLLTSTMLSLLGLIAAIWADKFDQMAGVTNFLITPLSVLSGTFYSLEALPDWLHPVALINPFFHAIDTARWAATGHADGPIPAGYAMLAVVNVALWLVAWQMLKRGYKLKA